MIKDLTDEELVNEIRETLYALNTLCADAHSRQIVLTVALETVEQEGLVRNSFSLRGAFKQLFRPLVLRI